MAFSPDTFGVVFRAGSAQLDRDPCQKRDPTATATATATAILHAAIFLAVLAVIQAFGSFRFRSEKVPNLQAESHFSDHYKLQNMSVPMVHPWGWSHVCILPICVTIQYMIVALKVIEGLPSMSVSPQTVPFSGKP